MEVIYLLLISGVIFGSLGAACAYLITYKEWEHHYFTPEIPFLSPNNYKETQYPVWNLLKELHAQGKLTPPQEFLCRPRMSDEELYDMQADPFETTNVIEKNPDVAAMLQALAEQHRRTFFTKKK